MKKTVAFVLVALPLVLGSCAGLQEWVDKNSGGGDAPKVGSDVKNDEALLGAEQGHIALLGGIDLDTLPYIPYDKRVLDSSPQFLISDDPEYIRVPEAVALREEVKPGRVRLYVYNVNGVKEPQMPRRISAVIQNKGTAPMKFKFEKYSFQAPTTNYFLAGKKGLSDYFKSTPAADARTLAPGESMPIDEAMEKSVANYDELVHGFYDFVIDQPAVISVVQTDPATPSTVANARIADPLPTKSKSGAGRGKFLVSDYEVNTTGGYVLDTKNGPAQLVVADGKIDNWVTGTESTTTSTATLKGNYGVMYNIKVPRKSSDGRGLALVTWNARYNPKAWCGGMAASVEVSDGKFPAGVIELPSNKLNTTSFPEVVVIQVFPPLKPGEEDTIEVLYSPPGASCLPTPLVFLPVDMKNAPAAK